LGLDREGSVCSDLGVGGHLFLRGQGWIF